MERPPRPFLSDAAGAGDAARVEALFDASSDAFFDLDLEEGTIRWTRGVTLLFGHEPAQRGDRLDDWRALIHPEDVERVHDSGRRVLPFGGDVWSDGFRLARSDGSYAPVRVRAVVIRGEDERPARIVGAVTDLSELRERETEIERLGRDLTEGLERERRERERAQALASALLLRWIGGDSPATRRAEPGGGSAVAGGAEPRAERTLADRQWQILELVRAGRTNKEIASELVISEQAAKSQVRKLMRKFGAPNRAALAAAAARAAQRPS